MKHTILRVKRRCAECNNSTENNTNILMCGKKTQSELHSFLSRLLYKYGIPKAYSNTVIEAGNVVFNDPRGCKCRDWYVIAEHGVTARFDECDTFDVYEYMSKFKADSKK